MQIQLMTTVIMILLIVITNVIWMLSNFENNVDIDTTEYMWDDNSFDYFDDKDNPLIRIMNQVGPCRVLAEGGCLGGLLAPRFIFSHFESSTNLNPILTYLSLC